MSAENIGTHFVDDLVNMAMTAKRVPELEAKIRNLETADELNAATIVELNKQLIDHVNAHAETKAKLSAAEASRDDAEFRFLEADDAKGTAVRTLEDMVRQAQELIKAVTPPAPVPVKPDYTGKWLTDVMNWSHITLDRWLECGGHTERFTVIKPVEAPIVPFVETASPKPSGETSSQDGGSGTSPLPQTGSDTGTQDQGVSVQTDPIGAPSVTTPSTSASTNPAEPVSVVPTDKSGQSAGLSVSPNPTPAHLASTTGTITPMADINATESPEVTHTGPFVPSIDSQSQSAPTGDAETKAGVSSQRASEERPEHWTDEYFSRVSQQS